MSEQNIAALWRALYIAVPTFLFTFLGTLQATSRVSSTPGRRHSSGTCCVISSSNARTSTGPRCVGTRPASSRFMSSSAVIISSSMSDCPRTLRSVVAWSGVIGPKASSSSISR